MLSDKIYQALNGQIALESQSSANYLAMACWCDREGLNGCSEFFYTQSDEERVHMLKLVHYVNEMGGHALVPAVQQPQREYESVQNVFQIVYQMEKDVTASIHQLLGLCHEVGDHATQHFLQWYVAEQREEEALVRTILDRIRLIGDGSQSLYYIDKELEKINNARLAAAAQADKADAPA
jgi:ferritin